MHASTWGVVIRSQIISTVRRNSCFHQEFHNSIPALTGREESFGDEYRSFSSLSFHEGLLQSRLLLTKHCNDTTFTSSLRLLEEKDGNNRGPSTFLDTYVLQSAGLRVYPLYY